MYGGLYIFINDDISYVLKNIKKNERFYKVNSLKFDAVNAFSSQLLILGMSFHERTSCEANIFNPRL